MGEMVVIGQLWRHDDEDGRIFLSGKLGHAKLLVLPNENKKTDENPDFIVYVASEKRQSASAPLPVVAIN